jgi:hypothetical protein
MFVGFIASFLGIVTAIYVVPIAGIALGLSPEIIFALIVPTGVVFAVFGLSLARARPVIADLWHRSSD